MVLDFQLSLKVCLPGLLNLLASSSGSSFIYTEYNVYQPAPPKSISWISITNLYNWTE